MSTNILKVYNRYKYALDLLPARSEKILDYGCFEGNFTNMLSEKTKQVFGIDVNIKAINKAKNKYPNINFSVLKNQKTEFLDNYFDVIMLLDVIEHVPSEEQTIDEIHRILKPGGTLIISAPYKGIFTFCDAGNIKFRFPRLHKFIYIHILKKKDEYYEKFVSKTNNLIGDISISENMFHKHYTLKEFQKIINKKFIIEYYLRFGLLGRILSIVQYIYQLFFHRRNKILTKLDSFDKSINFGFVADNIILKAKKK